MQDGSVADSQVRVFKIILSAPSEVVDPQDHCSIRVGDRHPINTNITCKSFDVRFDGDSRLVMIVTFNYESQAHTSQTDQNNKPPDLRAANWTTSTSLMETPVYSWRKMLNAAGGIPGIDDFAIEGPAVNAAGDAYDGVTKLTAVVNISIEQFELQDPTRHCIYAGYINRNEMTLGTLVMSKHTVMFRGVSSQPHVESWGGEIRRGWKATYEFAFKRNVTKIFLPGFAVGGGGEQEVAIGWDIAVPQTGFNVKAFAPPGGNDDDVHGQPLKHAAGRIVPILALPVGIAPGERVRGMVRVFEYEDGGTSQAPSASPIPLNDNGRPRIESANPKVLVYAYQVQPELDLTQTLQLRLQ
jgi:hypothetical protein